MHKMRPKGPLALVAIIALLAVHGLCLSEDFKQQDGLLHPEDAKQDLPTAAAQQHLELQQMAELEASILDEPEDSEVDEQETQVLPAAYKKKGWKVHKNKKCSRHGKRALSCPRHNSAHPYPPATDKKTYNTDAKDKPSKHTQDGSPEYKDDHSSHGGDSSKHEPHKHDSADNRPHDAYEPREYDEYKDKLWRPDYDSPEYKTDDYYKRHHDEYEAPGYRAPGYRAPGYRPPYEYKDNEYYRDTANGPYDDPYDRPRGYYRDEDYYQTGTYYPGHHQPPYPVKPTSCRGNPNQPPNGAFSCGNDKRAGDVCYAKCDVNYVGIPSATCMPDLTWGPVEGACFLGLAPLNRGAPSEPAIIGFATGESVIPNDLDGRVDPQPSRGSDRQAPVEPLAVCDNNPAFTEVGPSNTTCLLIINQKVGPGSACTAWFVQPDVVVTAGHCIKSNQTKNPVPLPWYNVDASDPGVVCCVVNSDPSQQLCDATSAWQVEAWASTNGWFETEGKNDAAVIRVKPFPSNTMTPMLQATKASDGLSDIPSRTIYSDGYPGNSSQRQGCTWPEFTGRVRREWDPQSSEPLNPPTTQGTDLEYERSSCPGNSGARIVDMADDNAFGILVRSDYNCSVSNTSKVSVTQLVDRALPDGAWLSSLADAIKVGKPQYKWVTPQATQTSCNETCAAIPGGNWRYINGGSPPSPPQQPTWALCASVLDLGDPYGKLWVPGQTYWNQKECRLVNPITGQAATGNAALTKCACTNCDGPGCSSLFWQPASLAQSCAKPRIANETGEDFYDVYSTICRSVKAGSTSGNMGWVEPDLGAPQQCAVNNQFGATKVSPVTDVSVWCAAEEGTIPSGTGMYTWARMPETCSGSISADTLNSCLDAACAASQEPTTSGWLAVRQPGPPAVQSIVCAVAATDDNIQPSNSLPAPNAWVVGTAYIGSSAESGNADPFCTAYVAEGAPYMYQAPYDSFAGERIPALVLCSNDTEPFNFVPGPREPPCSMDVEINISGAPTTFNGTACRVAAGTPGQLGTIPGTCVLGDGSEAQTFEEFCPPAGSFLASPSIGAQCSGENCTDYSCAIAQYPNGSYSLGTFWRASDAYKNLTDFGEEFPSSEVCCTMCNADPTCQGWSYFAPRFGFEGAFCHFYNDKALALTEWVHDTLAVTLSACNTKRGPPCPSPPW